MNWLKDFFFCDTWGDLAIAAILGVDWVHRLLGFNLHDNHSIWIGKLL
jgi:hypothetical protein